MDLTDLTEFPECCFVGLCCAAPEDRDESTMIIIIINITSIALKSSGARARKRNKTKSLIIFKSRGHNYRGHHQFEGPPTI